MGFLKSSLAKVLLPVLSVVLLLLALEFAMRLMEDRVRWPGYVFVDGVEFLHHSGDPGVNSLGFIDMERRPEKPGDVFRILLLGDSFIDGQKVDKYLENALAKAMPDRKFEVIPMAISGTGTLSHLAFYETLGKRFAPDMVVDVFVPNDFANNSNILEAVRLRFHPFRPGRNFATKVCVDGNCEIQPVPAVADFGDHTLKELPSHPPQSMFRPLEKKLDGWFSDSRLYGFMKQSLYLLDEESLYHRFDGEYAYRLAQLARIPGAGEKLSGWNYPADLDMDAMFLADGEDIPPAFKDALDYTACAFERFKALAARDGFIFLEVFSDSCTFFPESWLRDWRKSAERSGRSIDPANFISRLRNVAESAGIDFCDLYPTFIARGDILKAHLPNDNHWSDPGQQFAGEDIAACIVQRLSR